LPLADKVQSLFCAVYFARFVQRHDKKGEFKQQENGRKSGEKPFFRTNPAVLQAKKIPPAAF